MIALLLAVAATPAVASRADFEDMESALTQEAFDAAVIEVGLEAAREMSPVGPHLASASCATYPVGTANCTIVSSDCTNNKRRFRFEDGLCHRSLTMSFVNALSDGEPPAMWYIVSADKIEG